MNDLLLGLIFTDKNKALATVRELGEASFDGEAEMLFITGYLVSTKLPLGELYRRCETPSWFAVVVLDIEGQPNAHPQVTELVSKAIALRDARLMTRRKNGGAGTRGDTREIHQTFDTRMWNRMFESEPVQPDNESGGER